MSNGTKPGLLVADLLSGDGPHQALAASFVSATCAGCERSIDRTAMRHGDAFYCSICWARASGKIVMTPAAS
jgi:hypothetical protein